MGDSTQALLHRACDLACCATTEDFAVLLAVPKASYLCCSEIMSGLVIVSLRVNMPKAMRGTLVSAQGFRVLGTRGAKDQNVHDCHDDIAYTLILSSIWS